MVQASKKNEVDLHKNELKDTRNEVLAKREPKKEAVIKEVMIKERPKKERPKKERLKKEVASKELTKEETPKEGIPKEEIPKKEIRKEVIPKEEASKKMTLMKRKPSLHITFHNPNSDETMSSYLTKVLGERLADEIRKGPCT